MRTFSYFLKMDSTDEYRITNDFLPDDPLADWIFSSVPIRLRNIPYEGVVLCDIADYVKLGEFDENDLEEGEEPECISEDFAQNYVQILRGEIPEWQFCDISISPNIVVLGFRKEDGAGGECLHLSAPWPPYLDVMFEVPREDGSTDKYRLTIDTASMWTNDNNELCQLSLTEYEGRGKRTLNFIGSSNPEEESIICVTECR